MRQLLEKITQWLVGFGIEAYLHILSVMVIAAIVARVCVLTGAERPLATCIGAAAGMLAGLVKEFFDTRIHNAIEPQDYAADFIGAVLFVFIFI